MSRLVPPVGAVRWFRYCGDWLRVVVVSVDLQDQTAAVRPLFPGDSLLPSMCAGFEYLHVEQHYDDTDFGDLDQEAIA